MDTHIALASLVAAGATLCIAFGWRSHLVFARVESRLERYVGFAAASHQNKGPRLSLRARVAPFLARVSALVDTLLPEHQLSRIRQNLASAGFYTSRHLSNFLASKALLSIALGLTALLLLAGRGAPLVLVLIVTTIAASIGFYLPGLWLGRAIKGHRSALSRALPDALDLLSISVGAGLGFDSAILEVTQRWDNALTVELVAVMRDQRMGKSRREALRGLAERTGVPEIGSFVAAVIQASELGTPLRDTLRHQGEQIRALRTQRAEERARQSTILMLIPMVMFIFPSIFIVLLGPAIPSLLSLGGTR